LIARSWFKHHCIFASLASYRQGRSAGWLAVLYPASLHEPRHEMVRGGRCVERCR
jgi:hypothetical protein